MCKCSWLFLWNPCSAQQHVWSCVRFLFPLCSLPPDFWVLNWACCLAALDERVSPVNGEGRISAKNTELWCRWHVERFLWVLSKSLSPLVSHSPLGPLGEWDLDVQTSAAACGEEKKKKKKAVYLWTVTHPLLLYLVPAGFGQFCALPVLPFGACCLSTEQAQWCTPVIILRAPLLRSCARHVTPFQ